jgi:hypothetical protein
MGHPLYIHTWVGHLAVILKMRNRILDGKPEGKRTHYIDFCIQWKIILRWIRIEDYENVR